MGLRGGLRPPRSFLGRGVSSWLSAITAGPRLTRRGSGAALPGHQTRVRAPAGGNKNQAREQHLPTDIGIKELLEAGVHFGHQTRRWNPKMRRFIFGERDGIHIIDLQKTERLLHTAQEFAGDLAGRGGTILFVGTKKQARDTIEEAAERAACRTSTSAGSAAC